MSVSPFDVLRVMSEREKDITMFPSDNLKNIRTGKNGWGSVEMAVDNNTAQRIMTSNKESGVMFFLMVIDYEQYSEIMAELKAAELAQLKGEK